MKKVVLLLGPTGVGKTGVSVLLAKALNSEIISADSMQIYKGMDIGTAKPTVAERSGVRHHMIDIIEPACSFSAGRYVDEIVPVIEELHRQDKIPVIVGGTGLYIKAVTRGIFSGPSADWPLREELLAIEKDEGESLHALLIKLDPDAAAGIDRRDTRRVIRAIEVCMKSNDRISSLRQRLTRPLPYEFIKVGLTRERKELYHIIERRVDKMLADGLIEEVRKVLLTNPDRTPMQAIGYKEFSLFLSGSLPFAEAVALVKRNTRRYAKRQFTWFRKEEDICWVDVTGLFDYADIFVRVRGVLERAGLNLPAVC